MKLGTHDLFASMQKAGTDFRNFDYKILAKFFNL